MDLDETLRGHTVQSVFKKWLVANDVIVYVTEEWRNYCHHLKPEKGSMWNGVNQIIVVLRLIFIDLQFKILICHLNKTFTQLMFTIHTPFNNVLKNTLVIYPYLDLKSA